MKSIPLARHPKSIATLLIIALTALTDTIASAQTQTGGTGATNAQQQTTQARGRGRGGARGGGGPIRGVYKNTIEPHWFAGDSKFWYRNDLKAGTREFILVDADKGTRAPAFDHAKLAASLSKAAGATYKAESLPFTNIDFVDGEKALQFDVSDTKWKCDLKSYECSKVTGASAGLRVPMADLPAMAQDDEISLDDDDAIASEVDDDAVMSPDPGARRGGRAGAGGAGAGAAGGTAAAGATAGGGGGRGGFNARPESPDGKWTAFVKDMNVFVVSKDNEEVQLSTDGEEGDAYQGLTWSKDSQALVAWRVQPGDRKQIYWIQSSPAGGGRTIQTAQAYAQAGDKYALCEVNVFNIATKKQIKPKTDRWSDGNYGSGNPPGLIWEKDGVHFTFEHPERGHQRWRLVEVDSHTGEVRNLVDEVSKDFIWTAHPDGGWSISLVRWLTQTEELLYVSEKDGWKHLYLIDIRSGKIKNAITKGDWAVRSMTRIDEDRRQISFTASGKNPTENPYNIHYYRVNFDGTGMVELTEGNGTHTVQNSPEGKYIIDTYSRIDVPPTHTLHRMSDGKLMCNLEETDISELKATPGWRPVESFVAKGRDGKTDIYGTITWPRDFDPTKKYPVLENIYAGPQSASVQHAFNAGGGRGGGTSYPDLGFILVQIDGMGTPHRSHTFHAVCWQNLGKDNGFPDRILWHKAAAAKYPAYDVTRVGIYGTSAGGQSAASAVIFHSNFYRAAVANCGCVDNRIDKASWNEQWMGYMAPDKIWSKDADNWYSQCSCIDNAGKLGAALLLLVGEQDHNVPPESTLRLANELMLANKDFEIYYVPNAGHGIAVEPAAGSVPVANAFTQRKSREFFQRTLQGKAIPLDNSPRTDVTR